MHVRGMNDAPASKARASETTVDVYIKTLDGSRALALHNGWTGAATTALHTLVRAFTAGELTGQ